MPEGLTPIALPPPNQPIRPHNQHHHKINSRHIIHISGSDRHVRRKGIRGGREERPAEENTVGKETERAEPEGTMSDIVATADEKARNWNGIGYIEEDDAGCRHAVAMLLNAVEHPSQRHPIMDTMTQEARWALRGTFNFGSTLDKNLLNGRPRSRAKLQHRRDCQVWHAI